jgi:hypothetical protein
VVFVELPAFRKRAAERAFRQAAVSFDEEEAIARYRSSQAMAGAVREATRRAEAMARLELSLSLGAAA